MKFLSISGLIGSITAATKRFPMAMFCAVVGTCSILWLIDERDGKQMTECARLALVCFFGLALMTGLAIFSERKGHLLPQKMMVQAIGVLILVGCWFLFNPTNNFREVHLLVYSVGLGFLFHLFVSFAPYLDGRLKTEDFWEFNKQLFVNFLVGASYSAIIFSGLAIALAAINQLFHVEFRYQTWARMFTIIAGLFQTVYFLSNFPKDFDFERDEIQFESSVKNLVKWILIPIVGVYFLILYAYSGKILLTWQLPIGWVSSLVVGFSVAGIFAWLMNFYLNKIDDSTIISGFRKWFWWILSPMLLLLFVAVLFRINEYGLTEDRYLITFCGIWLAGMATYFIFFQKQDIRIIPVSLAIFTIIYLLPVIGGMDAGIRAQTAQLTQLLEKNGLLALGKSTPKAQIFDHPDCNRINGLVNYLVQRDAFEPIANWVGTTKAEIKKADGGNWDVSNQLLKSLGVAEYSTAGTENLTYKSLSWNSIDPLSAMPIAGFDSLHNINLGIEYDRTLHGVTLNADQKSFNFDDKSTDLSAFLEDAFNQNLSAENLEPIVLDGKTTRGKLIFTNLGLDKTSGQVKITYFNGYLLTARKR